MELNKIWALMCLALAVAATSPAVACAGPGPTITFREGDAHISESGREQIQNLALWASGNLDDIEALWLRSPTQSAHDDDNAQRLWTQRAKAIANLLFAYGIPEHLVKFAPVAGREISAANLPTGSRSLLEVQVELKADRTTAQEVTPGVYLVC